MVSSLSWLENHSGPQHSGSSSAWFSILLSMGAVCSPFPREYVREYICHYLIPSVLSDIFFSFHTVLGWWQEWGTVMPSLFPGGTSLAQASDPGLITVVQIAGLFLLETHAPHSRDSSGRTSWGCYPQEGHVHVAGMGSFTDPLGSCFPLSLTPSFLGFI